MGSYGQDEDLDEYEDVFLDDQDGDVGPGPSSRRYNDFEVQEDDDGEEEEEEEEEVAEEQMSEEALKILKYRQKLKEQLRSKMRKENGGGVGKSIDQGRRPLMNNCGSFFGPSQSVIAERVVQESKALLETRHLPPKASTSQNNARKASSASTSASTSGLKNGPSRPPLPNQVKSKAQIIKQTRDYSFLLADDADIPKPQKDPGKPKKLLSHSDARPPQVPAQSNAPSGHAGRKVVNGHEQRNPVRTPDNRARVVSSDPRRQLDLRKQPQPTKQVGTSAGNLSIRPPAARPFPPRQPSSSNDKRMPLEKKAPVTSASYRDRGASVSKQAVLNGLRRPVEKSRVPGVIRPQERSMSAQHNRDRVLKKQNMVASNTQMRPQKQSTHRANLDRDRPKVQRPNGQLSVHSQSGGVRKYLTSRKRRVGEMDDDLFDTDDPLSLIRGMFSRNRPKYVDYDDDEDDGMMEMTFDDIQREEARSARIAKKEDDEELAKIIADEKRDRLKKQAKMRKMSQR